MFISVIYNIISIKKVYPNIYSNIYQIIGFADCMFC